MTPSSLNDSRVAAAAMGCADYGSSAEVLAAIDVASRALRLGAPGRGPLGGVIAPGSRVVIKPNLVLHENHGPWGLQPLLTNSAVVQAATNAVLQAGAASVIVGDAPIQACDFEQLLATTGLGEWARMTAAEHARFEGIRDFRRTTCTFDTSGLRMAAENRLPEDRFVLFDLGRNSLLEPITGARPSFRVTCYDPGLMARTHAPGRHQYLIAREVIEADVVVNLPKLKTHMKAGITCALKNLVGINGNKEFLPHHRVGGVRHGGDCYPGGSPVKRALEYAADCENSARTRTTAWAWRQAGRVLHRATRLAGDDLGIEGAWSGNDTVWRMCLDLNRILVYGRRDGTLADRPARRVVHVVDAVVAGQGDGPLAPQPLPLGLILLGQNAAAIDWVGAQLLGYEPTSVPLVKEAFRSFRWPLAAFHASDVEVVEASGASGRRMPELNSLLPVVHPRGWRDAARPGPLPVTA
jgi:uncharacterized protein (DUF362 family)